MFVCAYARNLALQSPVPCQTSVRSFRSVIILELHNKAMYDFTEASPQVGLYYAVEYGKSYYIGRALGSPSGDSCPTTFNFLHCTGARSFDWPRRDDLEIFHNSHILWACAYCGYSALYNPSAGRAGTSVSMAEKGEKNCVIQIF